VEILLTVRWDALTNLPSGAYLRWNEDLCGKPRQQDAMEREGATSPADLVSGSHTGRSRRIHELSYPSHAQPAMDRSLKRCHVHIEGYLHAAIKACLPNFSSSTIKSRRKLVNTHLSIKVSSPAVHSQEKRTNLGCLSRLPQNPS